MANWQPISEFKPEEFPNDEESHGFFLVWLVPEGGLGWPEMAQWDPGHDTTDKDPGRPACIIGEWRNVAAIKHFQPVAFARIDPCTLFDGERQELQDAA